MQIGQLAKRAGITTDTIRYYEREGLLPPAARTVSGYRDYESGVLDDLRFIKKAQALKSTLTRLDREPTPKAGCRCAVIESA